MLAFLHQDGAPLVLNRNQENPTIIPPCYIENVVLINARLDLMYR
jgi:hypothetical protein